MMATTQLKFFLMCLCILVPHTTKGVYSQCSTPPQNQAAYEGTQNALLTCNSPTKVSYVLKPTSDQIGTYTITKYDDNVTTSLRNLFGVNSTGLIIKIAQGVATVAPISTAGLYGININGSTQYGAKFVVVQGPPTCNFTTINSTKLRKTCSLKYGDGSNHPISAVMTWTSNGNFYANDTPVRTKVGAYWVSTSNITVDVSDPATYQCTVTLANPTNIQFAYVATNAPEFCATCNSSICEKEATTYQTTTTIEPTTTPTTTTTEPTTTTTPTTTTEPTTTTTPTTTTEPTTTTTPTTTTEPTTTTTPTTTTEPTTTTTPTTTTEPTTTTTPTTTTEPTTTTTPTTTTESTTTTTPTTTTTEETTTSTPTTTESATTPSTKECNCAQNTTACPPLAQNCTQDRECQSGEIDWADIFDECVVKAELYVRYDSCCPGNLVCGVVVTLRNDSRWLIHDPLCDDTACETRVVDVACMSSEWNLLAEKKITQSGVGGYMQAGYIASTDSQNMTDCSDSCRRMINLQ